MRSVWIIARNTYREIIRDRILYGIIVFALLLIGLSLALGQLSFAEQARIAANFGFAGIQLSACVLAVFVGGSLVAKEIEKQTILTLLAKPISRSQFLLGKWVGLSMVIVTVMFGLAVVLGLVVSFLGFRIDATFFAVLWGVFLEALLLLSLALFFGTFARPMMTVMFTVSFFMIGHWVESLRYFIEKSQSSGFKLAGTLIVHVLPDLETFNWRSAPVYSSPVPLADILQASLYAGGWILLLMTFTSVIFRRRDFV